jgi:pimeloyl-ACP methyl ester carboxylesterase
MSDAKLLLVHGGWAGAWVWEPLFEPLRRRGIDAEAIERLPSVGDDPAALGDLDDDADHVRAAIDRIGESVVLCGHSYGGMVVTEVADHPSVIHSVYLAALWPQRGQSVFDLFGGELPDWILERDDGTVALTRDVERARRVLCADLDPARWPQLHARMLLQSEASGRTPSTAPARSHPATYVICNRDEAVPIEAQEAWAAGADHTVRLETAHMPQLSAPEKLADVLARIVTGTPAADRAV